MKVSFRVCLTVVALLASLAPLADAAPIAGVGVTASSELAGGFARQAIHLVDGSGLTGNAHNIAPDGFMWLSTGNACCGGAPDPNPVLTFDLGTLYNVDTMKVWNYNEGVPNLTSRGIRTTNISVAGTDGIFSPLIANQAFNQAPGTNSDFSQLVSLGGAAARYVQLSGMTHFPGGDNNFFGLSEVRFDGTPVGPPPPPPYPGLPVLGARASSQYTPDGRLAINAVNGAGLTIGNGHVTNPAGTMWLTDGADPVPTFEIDLGGVFNVDQLRVWNYNEAVFDLTSRGIRTADVYVAGADGVYGATPALTGVNLARAPGTQTDFSQTVSLGGASARYLMLTNTTNYGDGSFTGLSEVKVTGAGVQGQVPLPATIKSVSSQIAGFDRRAEYTANNAGLAFGDTHTPVPDGTMWLTQGTYDSGPTDLDPEIVYDLGSVMQLSRMKVYNYNEYRPDLPDRVNELLGRGVRLTDILVAGEDMVFHPLIDGLELDRAPEVGGDSDIGQVVDLMFTRARYIKFDILANQNGKIFSDPFSDDGLLNFVGLSEVQFFGVPEPSSYVLMLFGVASIACWRRRRNG